MKKRIVTLFVFLLIACLTLTACSSSESFEPDVEPTEELDVDPDFVEMNCYDVGGVTIRLNTRIEDYITDKKVFRFNDLAADLGWYTRPVGDNPNPANVVKITEAEGDYYPFIYFDPASFDYITRVHFGTTPKSKTGVFIPYYDCAFSLGKTGEEKITDESKRTLFPDGYYLFIHDEDDDTKIFFSEIVIVVYIMENYAYDLSDSFFDGVFENTRPQAWIVYE